VEKRPEDAVGESLIEACDLVRRQVHGHRPQFVEAASERRALLLIERVGVTGPADPESPGTLVRPAQPGGQPAGTALHLHLAARAGHRDGKPIGDDEQARLAIRRGWGHGRRLPALAAVWTRRVV